MRIKTILALPFTMVADAVSFGCLGQGSLTGDIIRADQRAEEMEMLTDMVKAIVEAKKGQSNG